MLKTIVKSTFMNKRLEHLRANTESYDRSD